MEMVVMRCLLRVGDHRDAGGLIPSSNGRGAFRQASTEDFWAYSWNRRYAPLHVLQVLPTDHGQPPGGGQVDGGEGDAALGLVVGRDIPLHPAVVLGVVVDLVATAPGPEPAYPVCAQSRPLVGTTGRMLESDQPTE